MTDLRTYVLVTGAYWGFTLTDGALRMLVLLHFHSLGYSPFEIASLFLFYELFGVVTNLIGGWIGSRLGLRITLFGGLALQVAALIMLAGLDADWGRAVSVAYVMAAQAVSGIAKDLTKMSSKSTVKLAVPEGSDGALYHWVAVLTGSKNALKGVGFFLGGLLLSQIGFVSALLAMAGGLVAILILCLAVLPGGMGRTSSKVKFSGIFSKSRDINVLSAARFFLFGSRDVWFVVALPVFLYDVLGWEFTTVGTFMAAWVIGYGVVQSFAPKLKFYRHGGPPTGSVTRLLALVLAAVSALIAALLAGGFDATWVVVGGLMVFGVVFALNSAVHSYLILAYTDRDNVALNVGFYYMANAGGRLAGTLLSGLVYQGYGLAGCLWVSALMVGMAWVLSLALPTTSDILSRRKNMIG